jgi:hypothetical protein
MFSEQRRCGDRGWLLYDSGFASILRCFTLLEGTDFSKINQSLHTTTFLAYGGRGQFCEERWPMHDPELPVRAHVLQVLVDHRRAACSSRRGDQDLRKGAEEQHSAH